MENSKNRFTSTLQIVTNVSIVLVALLGATVLIKDHLLRPRVQVLSDGVVDGKSPRPPDSSRVDRTAPVGPTVGTQISVPGISWNDSDETIVLALSNKCHFCTESAPFYQKLVSELTGRKDVRVIAVFPQDIEEGKKYLDGLSVPITQIARAPLDSLGVRGTPTLLIVDKNGAVQQSWVGRLNTERENEVLRGIKS
jgi:thiol-disulfide isomerase/thioredoxin